MLRLPRLHEMTSAQLDHTVAQDAISNPLPSQLLKKFPEKQTLSIATGIGISDGRHFSSNVVDVYGETFDRMSDLQGGVWEAMDFFRYRAPNNLAQVCASRGESIVRDIYRQRKMPLQSNTRMEQILNGVKVGTANCIDTNGGLFELLVAEATQREIDNQHARSQARPTQDPLKGYPLQLVELKLPGVHHIYIHWGDIKAHPNTLSACAWADQGGVSLYKDSAYFTNGEGLNVLATYTTGSGGNENFLSDVKCAQRSLIPWEEIVEGLREEGIHIPRRGNELLWHIENEIIKGNPVFVRNAMFNQEFAVKNPETLYFCKDDKTILPCRFNKIPIDHYVDMSRVYVDHSYHEMLDSLDRAGKLIHNIGLEPTRPRSPNPERGNFERMLRTPRHVPTTLYPITQRQARAPQRGLLSNDAPPRWDDVIEPGPSTFDTGISPPSFPANPEPNAAFPVPAPPMARTRSEPGVAAGMLPPFYRPPIAPNSLSSGNMDIHPPYPFIGPMNEPMSVPPMPIPGPEPFATPPGPERMSNEYGSSSTTERRLDISPHAPAWFARHVNSPPPIERREYRDPVTPSHASSRLGETPRTDMGRTRYDGRSSGSNNLPAASDTWPNAAPREERREPFPRSRRRGGSMEGKRYSPYRRDSNR